MDRDETTKSSSPLPEEKPCWQILALWVELLLLYPACSRNAAQEPWKMLLHFAACQMLFVPGAFALSFLILPSKAGGSGRASPADTEEILKPSSCCCLHSEECPKYRTTTAPKVRETLQECPHRSLLPWPHQPVTAAKEQVWNSFNSLKLPLNPLHRAQSSLQSCLTRVPHWSDVGMLNCAIDALIPNLRCEYSEQEQMWTFHTSSQIFEKHVKWHPNTHPRSI